MKTAGSSLIKNFIQYYGTKALYVQGGTQIDLGQKNIGKLSKVYKPEYFEKDLRKKKGKAEFVFGHRLRPCVNYDLKDYNFSWFTFLRDPNKRYVSHYFHVLYFISNQFTTGRYKKIINKDIKDWEKIDSFSNYQCKFIAGEANAQKAIDIIENKFEWVGITEEFNNGIKSLKTHFNLEDLYFENNHTNKSIANKNEKTEILNKYRSFIEEMNQQDQILYDYVKNKVWPRFNHYKNDEDVKLKSNKLVRKYNMLAFQIDNQINISETKVNWRNLKKFYKRWYR